MSDCNTVAKPLIRHLYVHVPFCTHICPYCAFYKTRNTLPDIKAYLPALRSELAWARDHYNHQPTTIFFGGGTPSALSVPQLKELFEGWPWKDTLEFTMEANPLTISEAKAALLRAVGVNRISLGAQAFDEPSLKILGRTHCADDIRKSVTILRQAGFKNINIDLMFALPGQTLEQWQGSLQNALKLNLEHISAYNLNYEEDTEFFGKLQSGALHINQTHERDFFCRGSELLEAAGYDHYEISNLALPGFASTHNQAYWNGSDYIGLGPGACSTVGLERWQNPSDTRAYAASLLTGQPCRVMEPLTPAVKLSERVLLGLRTRAGIPLNFIPGKNEILTDLQKEGLIVLSSDRVALTREGRLVADSVTELLI